MCLQMFYILALVMVLVFGVTGQIRRLRALPHIPLLYGVSSF